MNNQKKEQADKQNVRRWQGTVVSTKMQSTAVVDIVTKKMHSKYKKGYKVTRHFNCHNKDNKYKVGDLVIFEECRPLSKTKRWRIIKKIK